jgi:hypothetical protein
MNLVCQVQGERNERTIADTPATVDMATRVAWGPSNMYTAKTARSSDV